MLLMLVAEIAACGMAVVCVAFIVISCSNQEDKADMIDSVSYKLRPKSVLYKR